MTDKEAAQLVQLADKAIASAIENVCLNTDYYYAGTGLWDILPKTILIFA